MNILSIDTTADICSIALLAGNSEFIFHEVRPREHARILLPEIERLLSEARLTVGDLTYVVFGRGPGSFTGVRIATGVAQGLAYAAGCPVLPVSTLQSLAFSTCEKASSGIWVAIDARMSEVYFAKFSVDEQGIPMPVSEEAVLPPLDLPSDVTPDTEFAGNGWLAGYEFAPVLQGLTEKFNGIPELPHARDSAKLALKLLELDRITPVSAENALPVYLRDKVTWDNKPKVGS